MSEKQSAILALLNAIDEGWPHDDCCLKAEGHMPTCNKWKHEVIRKAEKLKQELKQAAEECRDRSAAQSRG